MEKKRDWCRVRKAHGEKGDWCRVGKLHGKKEENSMEREGNSMQKTRRLVHTRETQLEKKRSLVQSRETPWEKVGFGIFPWGKKKRNFVQSKEIPWKKKRDLVQSGETQWEKMKGLLQSRETPWEKRGIWCRVRKLHRKKEGFGAEQSELPCRGRVSRHQADHAQQSSAPCLAWESSASLQAAALPHKT